MLSCFFAFISFLKVEGKGQGTKIHLENNSMRQSQESYAAYVKRHAPKSPVLLNCIRAFWVGGLICAVGEGLFVLYRWLDISPRNASTLVTITLIFLSALFTGLGIFDRIGKYAGGGTLVPVTGFANAVVSPAMDCKSEGLILGVGAKIFTVAGPVILYATLCGSLWGVIYYLLRLLGLTPA